MTDTEQLLACEAIRTVKARYCRFLDTKQWDKWGDLFDLDIEVDVSEDVKDNPNASPVIRGRQVMVDQTRNLVGHARTVHQVHPGEIDFISDSEASAVWAMEDIVIFPDDAPAPFRSMHGYGHYYETYTRCEGVWRIARLKLARLHQDFVPRS